ncbi:MAG: hypothetical protein Kow0037_26140 [Calditrichia bacterium]
MSNWFRFVAVIVLLLALVGSVFAEGNEQIKDLMTAYKNGQELTEAQLQLIEPYLAPQPLKFGPPSRGLLNEGFEGGTIPSNWTVINADGGANQWVAQTVTPHTGTYEARVKYETASLQNDDWLITPPLNIQAGVNDTLKFWVKTYANNYADPFEVKLSTTGTNPADFTVLLFDTTGYMGSYQQLVFPLDAYDGQIVYVGIHYTGSYDWYCYADDFEGPEIYVPPVPTFMVDPAWADINDFDGPVPVGQMIDGKLAITNTGGSDLVISNMIPSTSDIVLTPTTLTVPPGATDSVQVTWVPTTMTTGRDTFWVEFIHNAPTSPDSMFAVLETVPAGSYVINFEEPYDSWFTPAGYGLSMYGAGYSRSSSEHWGDYAMYKSGSTGKDTSFVFTPRLDMTAGPAEMSFYSRGFSTADDSMEVLISSDLGATWSQVAVISNSTASWTKHWFDLSGYPQNDSTVIAFHYYYPSGQTSGSSFYIDDLALPARHIATTGVLYVSSQNVDFGTVTVGDTAYVDISLTNVGNTLNITSILSDNSVFEVVNPPTVIDPLQTEHVGIRFIPTTLGTETGNITITHDGVNGTEEVLVIAVQGFGFMTPTVILPWKEEFPTTTFDPTAWDPPSFVGTPEIIDVNGVASGTFPYPLPSDPYMLEISGTNDVAVTGNLDASAGADLVLSLWKSEHDLEPGEYVLIEYYASDNTWKLLDSLAGTDNGYGTYEPFRLMQYPLPGDAYHANLKLRFSAGGGSASTDEYYFDDISITRALGWANLQWPHSTTVTAGQATENIYGQVWIDGVTNQPGATPDLVAEVGYGPDGTFPYDTTTMAPNPDWTWFPTTFNVDVGNNDEFMGNIIPTSAGTFDYAYRYSYQGGPWVYADKNGIGDGYQTSEAGELIVNPAATPQKLLLSEIVVTPTNGEFIEIYNPNPDPVVLSDYYITDATHASSNTYYYQIVVGAGGGGGFGDFHARFPDGAVIAPGEYQTIALAGDSLFFVEYGVLPTYELYEDGTNFANDVPDMREAFPGSVNNQGGLTNDDEVVILYYWDGMSDLVKDVDYLIYDNAGAVPNEAVDKTGVKMDGPDADSDSTEYLPDTPIANQVPAPSPSFGFSSHRIDFNEGAQVQTGGNGLTGSDETSEDLNNTFTDNSIPSPNAPYVMPLPPGVFLMENFENGTLPAGWQTFTNSIGWLVGDSAALSSQYWSIPAHGIFAAANDDAGGSGGDGSMDYLITPALDLSSETDVVVTFQSYYDGTYGQKAYLEVSEDGGTTWTKVDSMVAATDWQQVTVDISAYAGPGHTAVMIAFHADDAGQWASGWAVDDIVVKKKETGTLAGTVTVNATSAPVDSARVSVNGTTVYTDQNGQYSISGLFAGLYEVEVYKEGFNVAYFDSVEIIGDSTTTLDVALTAPTMDLDVTAISDTVAVGDTSMHVINVTNNGDGALYYSLTIIPGTVQQLDYAKYRPAGTLTQNELPKPQKRALKAFHDKTENTEGTWLHYDGDHAGNIGLNGPGSWISAVRFTPTELGSYYGNNGISDVQFWINSADFTGVTVLIWEGGTPTEPGELVYAKDVTAEVVVADWTVHHLDYPIVLNPNLDYWVGYAIDATADHPSGADAGPIVAGKGGWIYLGGWTELSAFGINRNWNIRANVAPLGEGHWLAVNPLYGMLQPGNTQPIEVALFGSGIFRGDSTVTANIHFMPNPNVGSVTVPVSMTVTGIATVTPPANLTASQIGIEAKVELNWSHAMAQQREMVEKLAEGKEPEPKPNYYTPESFAYFNIYRSGSDMNFTQIASGITNTTFIDSVGLEMDSTYYYYVTAYYDPEGESGPSNTAMVVLSASMPEILFVDDDGSLGNSSYDDIGAVYINTMNSLSLDFDVYEVPDTLSGPDSTILKQYNIVIWTCGETWNSTYAPTLTSDDEQNLAAYLRSGGRLFLVAQDYFWDAYPSAGNFSPGQFPYDYLGVASVAQDAWIGASLMANGVSGSFTSGMAFTDTTMFGTTDLFVDNITSVGGDYLFEHTGPSGYSGHYMGNSVFRVVFSTLEWAGFVDATPPSTKKDFLMEVVTWLRGVTNLGDLGEVPTVFDLKQNYPNPFNPTTSIKYQVPQNVDVRLEVFNILGQRVKTLVNRKMDPGYYEVVWDGTNDFGAKVASGLYIYRIQAGDFVKSHKMILMK